MLDKVYCNIFIISYQLGIKVNCFHQCCRYIREITIFIINEMYNCANMQVLKSFTQIVSNMVSGSQYGFLFIYCIRLVQNLVPISKLLLLFSSKYL